MDTARDERIARALKFRDAARHSLQQLEPIDQKVSRGTMSARDAHAASLTERFGESLSNREVP